MVVHRHATTCRRSAALSARCPAARGRTACGCCSKRSCYRPTGRRSGSPRCAAHWPPSASPSSWKIRTNGLVSVGDARPRQQGQQHRQRADVENQDAAEHLVGRFRDALLRGLSASAAVMPTSSRPPKENMMIAIIITSPVTPCGRKPPWLHRLLTLACGPPLPLNSSQPPNRIIAD